MEMKNTALMWEVTRFNHVTVDGFLDGAYLKELYVIYSKMAVVCTEGKE